MLVSEALRPATTTDRWQRRLGTAEFAAATERAMAGVRMIETANVEEEALAIAVCLRETVEKPDKTAALVTPDRALARRVVAALERWQVEVDDSGGDALAETRAGIFACLAAEVALQGLEPAPLLALLKHSLLRLGAKPNAHVRAIAALECAVLRGPRPRLERPASRMHSRLSRQRGTNCIATIHANSYRRPILKPLNNWLRGSNRRLPHSKQSPANRSACVNWRRRTAKRSRRSSATTA